ncbi:hypothetical protein D3C75_396630 [compost metagenome]
MGQSAQEITQKLIPTLAVIFMFRRAHHGGDFRDRDTELLLSHDRQDIVGLQGKCDTQLFQHRVVVNTTLKRQLRGGFIFAALVIDQTIQETRQDDIRAADKSVFIFLRHPGIKTGGRGFHVGKRKNAHHVVIICFQGVAQATKNVITKHECL